MKSKRWVFHCHALQLRVYFFVLFFTVTKVTFVSCQLQLFPFLISLHESQIWNELRNQKTPNGFSSNFPIEVQQHLHFNSTPETKRWWCETKRGSVHVYKVKHISCVGFVDNVEVVTAVFVHCRTELLSRCCVWSQKTDRKQAKYRWNYRTPLVHLQWKKCIARVKLSDYYRETQKQKKATHTTQCIYL